MSALASTLAPHTQIAHASHAAKRGASLRACAVLVSWPRSNGVDNGKLWFDSVRVPRGALLDAFSQVRPEGNGARRLRAPLMRRGAGAARR